MLVRFTRSNHPYHTPVWLESIHVISVEAMLMATNPSETLIRMHDGATYRVEGGVDDVALALLAVPLLIRTTNDTQHVTIDNTLLNPVVTDEVPGTP